MLAAKRQSRIVELIQKQGSVEVEILAKELSVSPMTIRRDLVKLQDENRVERCHGGAVAKQEVTYADKQVSHKAEKKRLAKRCVQLVRQGDSIFLDAGTTTFEIARLLADIPDIMVVTNDLEIAQVLKCAKGKLVVCGGVVQKTTGSMLGYYATKMLEDFRFDIGFFGAASIDDDFQVMTPTIDKAFLKKEAVKRCLRSYLVVDESKFGRQSVTKINHLKDYEATVTTRIFSESENEKLEQEKIKIILV